MKRKKEQNIEPEWHELNPEVASSYPRPYDRVLVELKDLVFYEGQWHAFYAYAELWGPEVFWLTQYRKKVEASKVARWQLAPPPIQRRLA